LGARLPTTYNVKESVEAGGLMSYGANNADLFRRAADYVDKILRGTKPGDIPVEQPTKFDLVINLTTAKALGLEVPPTLLARVDTRSLQAYLGHKNIQHTVRYTELAPDRFKNFWRLIRLRSATWKRAGSLRPRRSRLTVAHPTAGTISIPLHPFPAAQNPG
jgi:hypothetical protein